MLTLFRKRYQWTDIYLPDGTKLSFVVDRVNHQGARLSFELPDDVTVMRREADLEQRKARVPS